MAYRGKRLLDLSLVVLSAPVWAAAVAVLAALVRFRIGTPVFFRQARTGMHERIFHIVKFRTMTDARGRDGELLPDADRLTAFGSFLRATSLDELPEFLNVLRGEMSLVGPRPLLPAYLPLYSERQRRRHEVRPGVTGLAQAAGRNSVSWETRLDLDVAYVERASFALDVRLLVRTVLVVLSRRGISAAGHSTMPAFTGSDDPATSEALPESPRSPDPDPRR